MRAYDRNCKLGAMRRMTAIATLAAAVMAVPAQATDSKFPSTSLVETMNRDGFAEFASFGADVPNLMVSPVLTWYVHRFLTLSSHDAQAAAFIDQLRRSGVAIDTTVHAARDRSGYTDRISSLEREDLGVKTLWDQPQGADDYAWTFNTEIRFRDDLGDKRPVDSDGPYVRAPFYARDGIRAVRLGAADGSRTLFVFWSTRAALADLRKRMSPDVWQSISKGFIESALSISNLALYRRSTIPIRVRSDEGFGSFAIPPVPRPNGVAALSMTASLGQVGGRFKAAAQGYPSVYAPGTFRAETTESIQYVPIPPERTVSAIVPMMYVIQDVRSGAILLLGQNG
jgi:hypothetical protein